MNLVYFPSYRSFPYFAKRITPILLVVIEWFIFVHFRYLNEIKLFSIHRYLNTFLPSLFSSFMNSASRASLYRDRYIYKYSPAGRQIVFFLILFLCKAGLPAVVCQHLPLLPAAGLLFVNVRKKDAREGTIAGARLFYKEGARVRYPLKLNGTPERALPWFRWKIEYYWRVLGASQTPDRAEILHNIFYTPDLKLGKKSGL